MTLRNTIYLAGTILSACLALPASAGAQALPTASTPLASIASSVPMLNGNYSYAFTASELLEFGNIGGSSGTSNFEVLSGDLQYVSPRMKYPTSLMYSAGLFLNGYAGHNTTYYQTLTASQGAIVGRWRFNVADSVSYLPQSPSIGLLGLPGLGDLGIQPLPVTGSPGPGSVNGVPPQGLLTNYANQVDNFLTGTVSRALNAKTTLSGTGGYGLFDFVDGGGVNSHFYMGQVDLSRRIDARDNLGANANYSVFTYGALGSFYVRSANLSFQRSWTRNLSTSFSAGPELMSGFNTAPITSQYFSQTGQGGVFVPPALSAPVPAQINVGMMASLNYQRRTSSATLFYMRGINGGSGIQIGAFSDMIDGTLQHSFSRVLTGSAYVSYVRTSGFLGFPPSTTEVGGLQLTRRFGRDWSVYGSYTGINQNVAAVLLIQNAYSGFYNTLAAGITFSPRPFHVNRF